jgi:1,4-alpha-glucan branching enzyme
MNTAVLEFLPADAGKIILAQHHDPFSYLGKHVHGHEEVVRAFIPGALSVAIADLDIALRRILDSDLFEWRGPPGLIPDRYRLVWTTNEGTFSAYDPYCFPAQISDYDLYLFGEGSHRHLYRVLGAHLCVIDEVHGARFAVWAPNAERVSVVGDFNAWDGRRHPMRNRGPSGVWELFIPGLREETLYKFEIRNRETGSIYLKADPYGQRFEKRPKTASIIHAERAFAWGDREWIEARRQADWMHTPISIYEIHLGAWQRGEHGEFLNYRELADRLVPYVKDMGFTHVELMPITEHPLDASWGYQTTGYYAVTSRYGSPDDFRHFVNQFHQHGIGVILDWVPAHFPRDAHGLARFDGSALYEHADPRRGEHRDWGTLIFNYGRNEVRNFLLSSALYWLDEFHIDGLRVDAVASMLYLDYSRNPGDWTPNIHGGNENLEAIDFLRRLNQLTHELHPGTLTFAEESTAWPMVSRPTWVGGLGFSMKWNMGWMNDTLQYMSKDPIYRKYQHDMLTFSQLYAFTENFVLPFSHDEVVHGKQSMLNKMPGDEWQRHANLRLLYTYMFTHPGKKLLFMGCEFAQGREWDSASSLDWYVLQYGLHQGCQRLVRDLNRLYREMRALHQFDFDQRGFEWIDCHDSSQSVLTYLRRSDREYVVVALNFTPVPRAGYRIGVPFEGFYAEIFNSDSRYYGGSDLGNGGGVRSEPIPWMNRPHSIAVTLPPLAGIVLKPA